LFCRAAAVVAWFLQLSTAKSTALFGYGVDTLLTIGLFYLMLAPHPDRYSLDRRLWIRHGATPEALGFFRRVLQIHLCFVYTFGGLTKMLGGGWWNGLSLWRALTRPPFDLIPREFLVQWTSLLPAFGIAIWMAELTYPIFIWPSRTRSVWLSLMCVMHLAIGLTMGMYLFALIMIVLNLAAFAPPLRCARVAALKRACQPAQAA
jgi:hypothetical protein